MNNIKKSVKKIIALLATVITILSLAQPALAVSGTGTFTGGQYGSKIYSTDNADSKYGFLIRKLINTNTKEQYTVFCAEHNSSFKTGLKYNGEYYTPTDETMKKACKVAYFGWYSKYGNYVVDDSIMNDNMYGARLDYVFVQQYIWEIIGQSNATFIDGGIQAQYEEFKNIINSQITNMKEAPSFTGNQITINAGETKIITDENNVLKDYYSIDKTIDGISIQHNQGENTLTIAIDNNCEINEYPISEETFKSWGMIKSGTEDYGSTIYFAFEEGVQNQLYALQYNEPISTSLNLKINNLGEINVNKKINYRSNVDKSVIDTKDLSGIEFKVTAKEDIYSNNKLIYKENDEVGKYNLDAKGNLCISSLPIGKYELQETKTINGLVLSDKKYEFNFKDEQGNKIFELNKEIKNDTTLIEISKTDITGDKELEGATLTVLDKNGKTIDKWKSSKNSHKIEGLTVGETYTLREEIAPNGYTIATDIKFTVKNTADSQKITMKDKIVEVTKTDITTGKELEGATLEVIDKEGNIVDTWTSTKESHKVKGLKENETYTLKEITAPYGYEIAEEITFKVTENKETQKIEMKDDYIKTNIILKKVDKETQEAIKKSFKFGLYTDEECTNLINEYESNKDDGTIIFENLIYGTYYVKEITAPNGYTQSNEVVKIEINDKGVFINDNILENNNGYKFNFENTKISTPKTGDTRKTEVFGILFIISSIGLLYFIIKSVKKDEE